MTSLFDADPPADAGSGNRPLADRMRPETLDDLLGQRAVLGPGTALRQAIERDQLGSIVLWGPPGCGKTTLGRIIAQRTRAEFVPFSAVTSGIKEVRQIMERAAGLRRAGRRTILFVDEIHRFNRAQQDAFLPHVERGTVVLIGATTQNPSFEINPALLSRSRVYRLERLGHPELLQLLKRALEDPVDGLGEHEVEFPEELLLTLVRHAQGDARAALNLLEFTVGTAVERDEPITETLVRDALQSGALYYDRAGEEHFNLISALHKSMRYSDVDASLYWLARMLESGEDPLYVARRIVRFASEDIGLADPGALTLTISAREAVRFVGLPEAELALAQAAAYCALAPKSDALYRAWGAIKETIRDGTVDPVPIALRNKQERGEPVTELDRLPASLAGRRFFEPAPRGVERELARKVERARRLHERPGDDTD